MKCLFQYCDGREQVHDVYERRHELRRNPIPIDRWKLLDRPGRPPLVNFSTTEEIALMDMPMIPTVNFRLLPGTGHELLPVFREER